MEPTLHKSVPLQTRVRTIKDSGYPVVTGRVVGVASIHIIFTYIVLLDEPILLPGAWEEVERHDAITVPGTALETEDGTSNWRITR